MIFTKIYWGGICKLLNCRPCYLQKELPIHLLACLNYRCYFYVFVRLPWVTIRWRTTLDIFYQNYNSRNSMVYWKPCTTSIYTIAFVTWLDWWSSGQILRHAAFLATEVTEMDANRLMPHLCVPTIESVDLKKLFPQYAPTYIVKYYICSLEKLMKHGNMMQISILLTLFLFIQLSRTDWI